MLPDGRRLGVHLPLAAGMRKALDRAREIDATTIQIFTDNPTAWKRRAQPPAELDAFRAGLLAADIAPVAAHASYLVNLAGPEPGFYERSIELLARELHAGPSYGVQLVNVHIGSHRDSGIDVGTRRLAAGVRATFDRAAALGEQDPVPSGPSKMPTLVLENSAGSGWGLGTSVTELVGIADALDDEGVPRDRVAFCLDTAHAWGAGLDLADPHAIDALVADFDDRIGLDRLVMLHLNDSRSERGSRLDRHEHIGAGRIGPVGMTHLLRHPRLAHAAYLLETPGMDEGYDLINLERARALAWGRPLADLPPGAFELRSSRARTAPP